MNQGVGASPPPLKEKETQAMIVNMQAETIAIKKDSTLMGFVRNGDYIFFGNNARRAASYLNKHTEKDAKGIETLTIRERDTIIASAELVAAGFALALLPT